MSAYEINLGDVTNCGEPQQCETCGSLWKLELVVLDTPVGALCGTQCKPCIDRGLLPKITDNITASHRVAVHCEHLGITPRRMFEILDEEMHDHDRAVAS